MLKLDINPQPVKQFALFALGFRPFFMAAGIYAVVAMLIWGGLYSGRLSVNLGALTPQQWHAHEMIYGYALAVIAGFLLTAVRNWTGVQTLNGPALALLFGAWLAARVLSLAGGGLPLMMAAVLDTLFSLVLFLAVLWPVLKVKQWNQMGIVSKVLLMGVSNGLFYLGALGVLDKGVHWGLYSGFYLVLALILVMGRRVIPFFIERGVGHATSVRNRDWVDRASLVVFLAFWIFEVFTAYTSVAAWLAGGLVVLHMIRIVGWYDGGVWRKPLLWILYLGYAVLILGFALRFMMPFVGISPFVAVHALALGGIAMTSLGMMARVALGHTGRDVQQPPRAVAPMLVMLTLGMLLRVVLPLLLPAYYATWVLLSQFFWIAAFAVFVGVYSPMLIRGRADGQPG